MGDSQPGFWGDTDHGPAGHPPSSSVPDFDDPWEAASADSRSQGSIDPARDPAAANQAGKPPKDNRRRMWIIGAAAALVSTIAVAFSVLSQQDAEETGSSLKTSSSIISTESVRPETTGPELRKPTSTPTPPRAIPEALLLLSTLRVEPELSDEGYDRQLFDHWIDASGNGCDTRCEVLKAERLSSLPGLAGGGWLSTYDGYSTDDASELDIDHVVALAEAWRSGAHSWDEDRRRDFSNDLEEPAALTAVTAATNRSKGARDPADWQPSSDNAWCDYASDWIITKARWDLSVDEAEHSALTNMLRGC